MLERWDIIVKRRSVCTLCMVLLFAFAAAGCGKGGDGVNGGDKSVDKNTEKAVGIMDMYVKKRSEYIDDDFFKGYEFYSAGARYDKRIIYNAVDDGSVINGYSANIQLFSLGKGDVKEEDCLKFAEVDFLQYMDSGAENIVQMSCIIKTPDKKKKTFVLRFANEERTRVVQYIRDGKNEEYKEVDNSYIEKAGKADQPRYFYTPVSNTDCLFKDTESGEMSSLNVNVSELVFGKDVDAGYACDVIMEKADKEHEEHGGGDYICSGTAFSIQTNGKNSAAVAVIYDEKGYKFFKFPDGSSNINALEKVEGVYMDREELEKELRNCM